MNYSKSFLRAVVLTLEAEGLFSDHAKDPGGKTMYGITEGLAREYGIRDVRWITKAEATDIYHRHFWKALHCDELPEWVALELFDAAVNTGRRAGVLFAQRAFNVLRNEGEPALAEDGLIGPATVAALARMGKRYQDQLVAAMNGEQYRHYRTLVEQRPERFRAFSRGWMRRLEWLHKEIA